MHRCLGVVPGRPMAVTQQGVVRPADGDHELGRLGRAEAGQLRGDAQDSGRLVRALPRGTQVGRIGLDQEGAQRQGGGGLAGTIGTAKGDRQREADQEAGVDERLGHRPVAREGVEHPATAIPGRRPGEQRFRDVGVGRAIVDEHREAVLGGERELAAEGGALGVRRREIAVVVEADLPHRPGQRIGGEGLETLPAGLVDLGGVVRVDAYRRIDQIGMAFGELQCGLGGGQIPPRDENPLDPGGDGAFDDRLDLPFEALVLEMGVGVDQAREALRRAAPGQLATSTSIRGKSGTALPVVQPAGPAPHARRASRPGPLAPRSSYGAGTPS